MCVLATFTFCDQKVHAHFGKSRLFLYPFSHFHYSSFKIHFRVLRYTWYHNPGRFFVKILTINCNIYHKFKNVDHKFKNIAHLSQMVDYRPMVDNIDPLIALKNNRLASSLQCFVSLCQKSPFPQNTMPLNKDVAAYKDKLVQMCRLFDRLSGYILPYLFTDLFSQAPASVWDSCEGGPFLLKSECWNTVGFGPEQPWLRKPCRVWGQGCFCLADHLLQHLDWIFDTKSRFCSWPSCGEPTPWEHVEPGSSLQFGGTA